MQEEYKCPLCCGETFESRDSLRYHLLSMSVNLYCPVCNNLCENGLHQLVDHLASECGVNTIENIKTENTNISERISPVSQEQELSQESFEIDNDENTETDKNTNEEPIETLPEIVTDEENGEIEMLDDSLNENTLVTLNDGSQIMVTTMDSEQPGNNQSDEERDASMDMDGEVQRPGEIYSCSSCGVNFTSIMEHIEQFHDGQEVVVEMTGENEDESTLTNDEFAEATGSPTMLEDSLKNEMGQSDYFDDDAIESTDSDEIDNEAKYPQLLNTLRQEECFDKDGRIYTRKVVQIEKFWDDKINSSKDPPVCDFFMVNDDGSMTKIDKSEVQVEEKTDDKIIKFYSCQRCQTQFSKLSQFNNHVCDSARANEYRCNQCEASFKNSKSLCAHMKAHKTVKLVNNDSPQAIAPFLCTKCDTIFPSNKSLRLHQRMHEPIKAKEIEAPVEYGITGPMDFDPNKPREMFICPVCNKTYDKGYEEIHMATHSGTVDYHCDTCNRKFLNHENLEMHMRVHNGGKPYSCSYCKNSFDTQDALTEHMEVHTKDRPYSCGYCGRKFARPHEKVKHERIHTGEKPHECEICGKTFRVSYCLTLHMRTHTGARPYVCKHCGKRFKAHSVYNHHLLTHSDQRNYKCPFCPKAFKTGVQLAGHKNSHTKPFSCTECNRPFASLYAVRNHMDSHKRENNLKFSCYLCGASYARNFALRDHIKEVHNTTPVVITSENGNVIMSGNKVKIEELENLKASNSILEDETEIALNQLRAEESDEEL